MVTQWVCDAATSAIIALAAYIRYSKLADEVTSKQANDTLSSRIEDILTSFAASNKCNSPRKNSYLCSALQCVANPMDIAFDWPRMLPLAPECRSVRVPTQQRPVA